MLVLCVGCNSGTIGTRLGMDLLAPNPFAEVVFRDAPDHHYELAVRKGWLDLDTTVRVSAVVHQADTPTWVIGAELRGHEFVVGAGLEDELGTGVRVYSDGTIDGYITLDW